MPADSMPMFSKPSYELNFPCTNEEFACNPEVYIESISSSISYDARIKLVRTVLRYVK